MNIFRWFKFLFETLFMKGETKTSDHEGSQKGCITELKTEDEGVGMEVTPLSGESTQKLEEPKTPKSISVERSSSDHKLEHEHEVELQNSRGDDDRDLEDEG